MTDEAPRPATLSRGFAKIAEQASHAAGQPLSFSLCVLAVIVWAVAGPVFHYSNAWLLVVNTATSIATFLMVFLIQSKQNRDDAAIQTKLNELIRALEPAKNKFVGIETLTVEEVREMRDETVAELKIEQDALETAEAEAP
jgi:low affinity Fe/Cu permease